MEDMIEQQIPALREKVQARLTKPGAEVTDEELTGILKEIYTEFPAFVKMMVKADQFVAVGLDKKDRLL